MRLIGYIRVSRVGGRAGDSFISPQQQRDRIEAHARAHSHTVIDWREDLDVSGAKMERIGLEEAITAIEVGAADGLAVAKLDRFARSVSGAAKTLARIEAAGGVLVAIDLGMDTSTSAGKLMRNVLMALAEFDLDRIRESWDDAQTRAVRRGVHISARVPFGYRKGDDGRLTPDPETAPIVLDVFRMRGDDGRSWREIAAFLNERAPRDTGGWPIQTVASIVSNSTYLGVARSGDRINPEAHEPLVDRPLFDRAQVGEPKPLIFKGGSLLAPILRCAGCSYLMSLKRDGRRAQPYYRCRRNHAAGDCTAPAIIDQPRIDDYVSGRFLDRMATIRLSDSDLTVDVERAAATLEQAEAELVAYRDANLVSVLGPAVYREGLEQRARIVDDAREQLAGVRRTSGGARGYATVAEEWPNLMLAERRELLAAAIDAVFVKRGHLRDSPMEERVRILWAGSGPADLPGRRMSGVRPYVFPDD